MTTSITCSNLHGHGELLVQGSREISCVEVVSRELKVFNVQCFYSIWPEEAKVPSKLSHPVMHDPPQMPLVLTTNQSMRKKL